MLETGTCTTQKAAAERANLNADYLSRALKNVGTQAFITRKRAENIAIASIRASRRYGQLIDATSEHVSAKVCERILETTGDLKMGGGGVNVSINNNLSPGYVIDLSGKRTIDVEGEQIDHLRVIDAKPLISLSAGHKDAAE
ncbi:MAG: hypothetical protein Q7R45_07265 [Sulfuricaulis sp.]|nr:hypothetical protein [Sulfuricaulis sp.]